MIDTSLCRKNKPDPFRLGYCLTPWLVSTIDANQLKIIHPWRRWIWHVRQVVDLEFQLRVGRNTIDPLLSPRQNQGICFTVWANSYFSRNSYVKHRIRNVGICVGDRILSCNNQSLLNSTHREAVDAIKNQSDVCTVEVQSQVWESRPWPIKPPEIYQ